VCKNIINQDADQQQSVSFLNDDLFSVNLIFS